MKKISIISPSGNFYGSEQVLFDFLITCKQSYRVEVPIGSSFWRIMNDKLSFKHDIRGFRNIPRLYFRIFLDIFLRKIDVVYCNEGGHIKWILLLARLYRHIRFIIHVRIVEDIARIPSVISENIRIVTISEFMKNQIPSHTRNVFFYDSYAFNLKRTNRKEKARLNIAIIGRISKSKGLYDFADFLNYISSQSLDFTAFFHVFGTKSSSLEEKEYFNSTLNKYPEIVKFHGFKSKEEIYDTVDAVLHLAHAEPLGRIFFEAVENSKPIVGFNTGGIGELMKLSNLSAYTVDRSASDWKSALLIKLSHIESNYDQAVEEIVQSLSSIEKIFNQKSYNSNIINLFHE